MILLLSPAQRHKAFRTDVNALYENIPIQYTAIFKTVKIEILQSKIFDIFNIFVQNIDCGYVRTTSPRLKSTYNLCS